MWTGSDKEGKNRLVMFVINLIPIISGCFNSNKTKQKKLYYKTNDTIPGT